jgi:hypothetical protein
MCCVHVRAEHRLAVPGVDGLLVVVALAVDPHGLRPGHERLVVEAVHRDGELLVRVDARDVLLHGERVEHVGELAVVRRHELALDERREAAAAGPLGPARCVRVVPVVLVLLREVRVQNAVDVRVGLHVAQHGHALGHVGHVVEVLREGGLPLLPPLLPPLRLLLLLVALVVVDVAARVVLELPDLVAIVLVHDGRELLGDLPDPVLLGLPQVRRQGLLRHVGPEQALVVLVKVAGVVAALRRVVRVRGVVLVPGEKG